MSEERLIDSLKPHPINERIYGDLFDHELIKSIEDYGFKGSIEITKDDVIISGHRRYNACQELGYETIPVTVIDIEDPDELINYLIRMNQSQRKRTNEQIAAEFEVLKEIETRRADARKVEAGRTYGRGQEKVPENFPEPIDSKANGEARDKAAEKLNAGWSGRTAEDALKVKNYADELRNMCPAYPDIANQLISILNNRSVNAAVNEMKKIKADFIIAADKRIKREEEKQRNAEMAAQLKPSLNVEISKTELKPASVAAPTERKKEDPKEFFNPEQPVPVAPVIPIKKSKFNSTNDNIEWAKWSWNPVTGCLHDCQYCYARDIAVRYNKGDFSPAFHEGRLNAPQFTNIPESRINEPGINNVFVCSMADLFGKWVNPEWIQTIIDICREQSQWTYLMLTKNPERYLEFEFPENCWLGASATNQAQFDRAIDSFETMSCEGQNTGCIKFLSCEPLNEQIVVKNVHIDGDGYFSANQLMFIDWIIIGGRSESMRMPAFQPEWMWVQHLIASADAAGVPIYFKPNLTVRPRSYPKRN